jgi:hypothetical protein
LLIPRIHLNIIPISSIKLSEQVQMAKFPPTAILIQPLVLHKKGFKKSDESINSNLRKFFWNRVSIFGPCRKIDLSVRWCSKCQVHAVDPTKIVAENVKNYINYILYYTVYKKYNVHLRLCHVRSFNACK